MHENRHISERWENFPWGGELFLNISYIGYILVLIGGVLLILFGLLGLVGIVLIPFSMLFFAGVVAHGLITLIIGVISVIGSKYVARLDWAIILLILGIVASGLGGALIILGSLLGLVSNLTRRK